MANDEKDSIKVMEPNTFTGGVEYFSKCPVETVSIKDLDEIFRPIEKLKFEGPQSLSDMELIAILLGSGYKGCSCIELALKILTTIGNHEAMMDLTIEELTDIKGVGTTKAARIISGLELGKRISKKESIRELKINSPKSIAKLFMERYKYAEKESFSVLMLDTKNQIIGEAEISVGDLNSSIVNPREVFKIAVKRSSNSVVLIHNHPSGDIEPSGNDIAITKRLVEAGNILGIKVLDHLIIGYNTYFSMREHNIF